jgi:uncharacterized LabA/DUF88 family protein
MKGWSGVQAEFGIVPHHQPANTVGKNASDIALVIDAMDLMHSGRFDGFVLVSARTVTSPGWPAASANRGSMSIGIGQQKTPEAFRKACKRFIFIENILGTEDDKGGTRTRRGDQGRQARRARSPVRAT